MGCSGIYKGCFLWDGGIVARALDAIGTAESSPGPWTRSGWRRSAVGALSSNKGDSPLSPGVSPLCFRCKALRLRSQTGVTLWNPSLRGNEMLLYISYELAPMRLASVPSFGFFVPFLRRMAMRVRINNDGNSTARLRKMRFHLPGRIGIYQGMFD